MERWIRCAIITVLLLAGIIPALATSQTPEDATPFVATPQPAQDIQVVVLADTADVPLTTGSGSPEPAVVPPDHRLARITMRPGASFSGPVLQSALIYVESGRVSLSPEEAAASVSVGDGAPIVAADGGGVVCERDVCPIEPGQTVILGAGNSLSSVMDSLMVRVEGAEPAVLEMSAVLIEGHRPLCWICPTR